MGTRADFYVGRFEDAEWLGSIAYDGGPDAIAMNPAILRAKTERAYRKAVGDFLGNDEDAILAKDGWPWGAKDSSVTDWSYYFEDGTVWIAHYNSGFWTAEYVLEHGEDDIFYPLFHPTFKWPNMRRRQKR